MSKIVSTALLSHYQQTTQTLARCLRITQQNDKVIGLTEHDDDILFEEVLYQSAPGYGSSALQMACELAPGTVELSGILSPEGVSKQAILRGLFDQARIELFEINYEDLSSGKLVLFSGFWGETQLQGNRFSVECQSRMQLLQQPIGELYSAECRAQLGDKRCQVPLPAFTHKACIVEILSSTQFIAQGLTQETDYFKYGQLIFESGQNTAVSIPIKGFQIGGVLQLQDAPPCPLQVGDAFSVVAGCNKNISTCHVKFNNTVNFRGEPFVPGQDHLSKYPDVR